MSTRISAPEGSRQSDSDTVMVLLVDDQAMVGEAIRRNLIGEPRLDFHYCSDPAEAFDVARRIRPTVILQDLVMPGADGIEMVRQYRATPLTQDVPIIVLSTREEPKVKAEAFAAGANDYLVKLPDRVELVARIRYHSKAYLNLLQRDEAFQSLRESQKQLMEMNIQLQRLMNMDGLTGLNNRRRFDEYAAAEWSRAIRERSTVAMLMIDVDYFKKYNDTYGHLVGDEALKKIAETIQQSSRRPADLVARFGGEEFVMILPMTEIEGAMHLGEMIRSAVEALQIPHGSSSAAPHVTTSIGCAAIAPSAESVLISLLEAADAALYEAKRQGRNRVAQSPAADS